MYYNDCQYVKLTLLKNSFCLLFTSAFTSGHLLRCESLEIEYYVGGFRRLASDLN
jgi:hypothetical protein